MNKENQLIMVIKKENLFKENYFQGFMDARKIDFEKRILKNFKYIKRGLAEKDASYKQPIGYIILTNKRAKRFFIYQRAKRKEDYDKRELCEKWSLGLGGHIDKSDYQKNSIKASTIRELEEEVKIDGEIKEIKLIGYINDDSNEVGRVHFCILYLIDFSGYVFPQSSEIKISKMAKIEEIDFFEKSKNNEIEEWSKIAFKEIKNII